MAKSTLQDKFTQDCADKVKPENKPIIAKSMQPKIDALVKLVKQTHAQLPAEGVDVKVFNEQITKFNHAIKLPSGEPIKSCFIKKSIAETTYDAGASSSQHHAPYEICPGTSDSEEDTALAGKTELHRCCCEIM